MEGQQVVDSPEELDALILRANALMDLERFEEAKAAFKAARKIKPRALEVSCAQTHHKTMRPTGNAC